MSGKNDDAETVDKRGSIFELSRTMVLAAIGVVAVAEDEITRFVDRLVDRGEIAEKDARKLIQEVIDRREKMVREKKEELQRNRPMTVATKADVEALNAKITELSEKIEALKKG